MITARALGTWAVSVTMLPALMIGAGLTALVWWAW